MMAYRRLVAAWLGVLLLCTGIVIPYLQNDSASALNAADWKAGRIIDDAIFFNKDAMSVSQIQQFLNAKVPVCDTNHNASFWQYGYWNAPPYTCLKDYQENGKSSAQIIWDSAQTYGINPQVLLVILQKETGIVTDTWAAPWQYKRATGYRCPDSSLGGDVDANQNGCYDQYENFSAQVGGAAYRLRDYVTNANSYNFKAGVTRNILYNPSSSCGSSPVYIVSAGTAALYNYTPYQPNAGALATMTDLTAGGTAPCGAYGNRNFFWFFNKWFGSSVVGWTPSPLYKSTDTHQIFAVFNLTKHLVTSPDILVSFGLDRYPAAEVSGAILNNFTTGTPITSSLAKKAIDPSGTIYFFDGGKRFPVTIDACKYNLDGSLNPTTSWAFDCFNGSTTLSLPNELIDNFTAQDITLSPMAINAGTVWKMENGKKRRITEGSIVETNGGWAKAKWMQDYHVNQPEGKLLIPDNIAVKFSNSPQIFVHNGGKLYPISSLEDYYAWRLNEVTNQNLSSTHNTTDPLPVSESPIGTLVTDSANNKYMLTTTGKRVSLQGTPFVFTNDKFTNAPDNLIARLPSEPLSQIFRAPNGSIFIVNNGKKLVFPTFDDLYFSGYKVDKIQPLSSQVADLVPYDGSKLSAGRLVKVTGDDTIRYIYAEGASLAVYSSNFPGLPYDKLITVDTATSQRYPIVGTYH